MNLWEEKKKAFSGEKIQVYREKWVKGEQTRQRQRSVNIYSVEDDILTEYSWREDH